MTGQTRLSPLLASFAFVLLLLSLVGCAEKEDTPTYHVCDPALVATGRTVECATLTVPENWAQPGGNSVILELVIVRAVAPMSGLPPVIYLHGGPGGSVLEYLAEALNSPIGKELVAQDQDWIFFDQRGTGKAIPRLDCGPVVLNDSGPASEAEVGKLIECGEMFQKKGIDLGQYHSRNVALDIQEIRKAVGAKQFDLYGLSYGTRVAATTLLHQPQGLRAIVYDSPWPPEAKWTEPGPAWVSREARELLRFCERQPRCLAQFPNLEQKLEKTVRAWLESGNFDDREKARRLALFLTESVYDAERVENLPRDIDSITRGNLALLAAFEHSDAGYSDGLHMAVMCNEELPFEQSKRVLANGKGDPLAEAVAITMSRYSEACPAFRPSVPPPSEQSPVRSDIPVLFMAAGIDAGCPAELSVDAVKRYRNGRLLLFPYTTHQLSLNNSCARQSARKFLRDPEKFRRRVCADPKAKPPTFSKRKF